MKVKSIGYSLALLLLACTGAPDLRFAHVAEGKRVVLGDPLDLTIEGLPTDTDSMQYYVDNRIWDTKRGLPA